jgi:23S rRNA (cytosine1962-C5)-methyltransferase
MATVRDSVSVDQPLRVGAPHPQGPAVTISRRAADRLREGSVWVYRSEIEALHARSDADGSIEPGSVVTVLDARGIPVGSALFSSASQITLRLFSTSAGLQRADWLALVAERTAEALALRRVIAPASRQSDSARLIFSEADRLPGIVVDRYNDVVVVQLLTQGTAQDDVRATLTQALTQALLQATDAGPIATIVERADSRIRKLEQLAEIPSAPLFSASEEPKLDTVFTLNGLQFAYDATAGQKTGAFLDQSRNYAAAAAWGHGNALDVCTYQGGFALHLAQACERVTGVDASRAALEVADSNLGRNPQLKAKVDWMEADAFELLREYQSSGRRYDTIVLDPPAFAKSKRAAEGAARGYKELNLRALGMLSPGGTLVTCSCSHHVDLAEFTSILAAAASDAGRRVQVLETRGAAPDHPAILSLPETSYLKCVLCRVL